MATNEELQVTDVLRTDRSAAESSRAEAGIDAELWRNRQRSARKRTVQGVSIDVKRIPKRDFELDRFLYRDVDVLRPRTRAECATSERPCLFVSCKHHLYLDVAPRTGAIKLNFPDLEVTEMTETCVLDVADRGGTAMEEVGAMMNLTRERIRQVEVQALSTLAALSDEVGLREFDEEGPVRKRRLPIFVEEEDDDERPDRSDEGKGLASARLCRE